MPSTVPAGGPDAAAAAPPTARIAVARDRAFAGPSPTALDALRQAGAELLFFSPLDDLLLPERVGLVLLLGEEIPAHLAALEGNVAMRRELRVGIGEFLPVYAEGAAVLYLARDVELPDGTTCKAVGGLRARVRARAPRGDAPPDARPERPATLRAIRDTWLCAAGTEWPAVPAPAGEFVEFGPEVRVGFERRASAWAPAQPAGLCFREVIALEAHALDGAPAWLVEALVRRAARRGAEEGEGAG
ncbi:MAG: hypothetical protein HZA54_07465 [Planctomycetes bacterium]|nr:hypothetical protein [Planctomycetota bacterium]